MKIAHCNMCNHDYEDPNPGPNSIDYTDEELDTLISIKDEECQSFNQYFWGCPICKTDGYLIDNKQII